MASTTFDLEAFIADCSAARQEAQPQLAVREVVERAVSDPDAIDRVLGEPTGWCIDTLHHTADLTILHFVWPPGVDLFPHDHQMWSTVGIYAGREDNAFYRRDGDRIVPTGGREGGPGDVLLLGTDGIHSVSNPTRQWTAAIHVYGGDFFNEPRTQWDPETGTARPFDVNDARRVLEDADVAARRALP